MSKTLLIGGGQWQIYILNYLKNKGDYIGIVNPVETQTTLTANEHILADVKDVEKIVKLTKKSGFEHITSDQSDVCALPAAEIASRLGLHSNSVEAVKKFSDKYLMYLNALSKGVPVPVFDKAFNELDVKKFAKIHGYPVIVKPANSTSSRGFGVINAEDDIGQKVTDCIKHLSKTPYFIVQKYVSGIEVTIEGVVSGGKHKSIATSSKNHFRPGIASSLRYPSCINLNHVIPLHDKYINESGLSFGITHAEYIIDGNSFWFVECGARGGGCGISSEIVPHVSNIHPYEVLYKGLKGEIVDLNSLEIEEKPAMLQFFEFLGWIKEMPMPNDIPGLHSFLYNFKLNDYLEPATTDSNRHSMAIFLANTNEEINKALLKLQTHLLKVKTCSK